MSDVTATGAQAVDAPPTGAPEPAPAADAAESATPASPAPAAPRRERKERRPKPLLQATGRRKAAIARLTIRAGSGVITVNGRPIESYFPSETHRMIVTEPLRLTTTADVYDIDATIDGGGTSGQAGALRLGIARALVQLDGEVRISL
jgi:small subunit ribosomal protein S9